MSPQAAVPLPGLQVRRGAARGLSALAAIAVFLIVGSQLWHFGFDRLVGLLPSVPAFFILLLALHLVLPVSEWVIYRRLWQLPAAGIAPLLRKGVINDLVLSYGGEIYLYDWARRHISGGVGPFRAIKDVSILSAMVANVVTVAVVAVTAPWIANMLPPGYVVPLLCSVLILLVVPIALGIFASRVFSLTRDDILFVSTVHALRIAASIALTAALWTTLLPAIPFGHLVALQTLRLLVSRMPLVANDEFLFASITILVAGHDSAISTVAALTAMALVALHLATFAILLARDLAARLIGGRNAG